MRAISNSTLVEAAARRALTAQEFEQTAAHFRRLCVTPGETLATLDATAEILREAGFKQELMHLLREALRQPDVNPHVGTLWIRRVITSKIWDHRYPEELDELCQKGEVGQHAVIEFLELAGRKRRGSLVLKAIARHQRWLCANPAGWAAAGRALTLARCYRQAARWMGNWREQASLDNSTLYCLALAFRAMGRRSKATEVVHMALDRPGMAEEFPMLKLWVAQDQAFSGETQAASTTFKQIDPSGWEDDTLACYYLVRGVIRVQKAQDRKEAFEMARERIGQLFRKNPIWKRDVYLRREYHRCLLRMAKDAGNWSERLRARWRSANSAPLAIALLLVPGLQVLVPCYLYRLCSHRRGASR
jgi:tetratricopeptide (TPR) repeat protein